MEDLCYNSIIIKGKMSNVLQVINDSIANSVQYRNEFKVPIEVETITDINKTLGKLKEMKIYGQVTDTILSDLRVTGNKKDATLFFTIKTKYLPPNKWLRHIKLKHPNCNVFQFTFDEWGVFFFYGEVDSDMVYINTDIDIGVKTVDKSQADCIIKNYRDFLKYISDYKIGEK